MQTVGEFSASFGHDIHLGGGIDVVGHCGCGGAVHQHTVQADDALQQRLIRRRPPRQLRVRVLKGLRSHQHMRISNSSHSVWKVGRENCNLGSCSDGNMRMVMSGREVYAT